ncbi:hypothetical protein AGR2A_pb10144 [Agrobacterium genomosp. 2 str. CFBP 5494]|uniref:Uncharacterized protein n=1 Tax=Agrobacterium genomosp. 2 str. CFBP 5494 TaxID=1183436 RepID=A0A9W5B7U0_9HYPH|nr:hypothetical protein AGR2A_pb10144 [Agrobacterium genomosp. 2 str. CFBP 5494]
MPSSRMTCRRLSSAGIWQPCSRIRSRGGTASPWLAMRKSYSESVITAAPGFVAFRAEQTVTEDGVRVIEQRLQSGLCNNLAGLAAVLAGFGEAFMDVLQEAVAHALVGCRGSVRKACVDDDESGTARNDAVDAARVETVDIDELVEKAFDNRLQAAADLQVVDGGHGITVAITHSIVPEGIRAERKAIFRHRYLRECWQQPLQRRR